MNQCVAIADQHWRIEMTPLVVHIDWHDRAAPAFIAGLIVAISMLLFWLVSSLASAGRQNLELADRNRGAAALGSARLRR